MVIMKRFFIMIFGGNSVKDQWFLRCSLAIRRQVKMKAFWEHLNAAMLKGKKACEEDAWLKSALVALASVNWRLPLPWADCRSRVGGAASRQHYLGDSTPLSNGAANSAKVFWFVVLWCWRLAVMMNTPSIIAMGICRTVR